MQRWTIRYQYGHYRGEEVVYTSDEADQEEAISRMWEQFRSKGYLTLSMAFTSARVVRRDDVAEEGRG